jgi:DNA repair protein RadD
LGLLSHQKPVVAALTKHFKTRQTVKFGERDIHPPVIVSASVSSGKSVMLAECAKAVKDAALAKEKPSTVFVMVIQNQGLLCAQNSAAAWDIGLNNSVFSASCGGRKSTHYSVVYGTIGTIARALETYRFSAYTPEELAMSPEQRFRLNKWFPDLILIDEVHQVPFENVEAQYMKVLNHFYDMKPHLRLAGMTGSPFRGSNSIVGTTLEHLWKSVASIEPGDPDYPPGGVGNGIISTEFSADQGWILSPIFGYPDDENIRYDFSHLVDQDWAYPESDLDAAVSDKALCLSICADFIRKTVDRKGVLIFAATKRHTRQIAAALKLLGVDPEQIGVITENTPQKEQTRILDAAKAGKLKFTINVSVLTTGVNVAWWDSVVFMRPIASIVLLIQAIGRVLRLLIEDGDVPMLERDALTAEMRKLLIAASNKPDALVLDYANVMDTLGHLYESPILEAAELDKAKKEGKELIECPKCMKDHGIQTMNSPNARRCIGKTGKDPLTGAAQRCDHFWHFRLCPGCGTQNDQVARECRNAECRRLLVDPNASLNGKHYVSGESIPVRAMTAGAGSGGKFFIRYELSTGDTPIEIFYPHAGADPQKKKINTAIWAKFVDQLPIDSRSKFRLKAMKASTVAENLELIPVPNEISARKKGEKWTVGRRWYAETENFMEATA